MSLSESKPYEEWGINLSQLKRPFPRTLLWRLSFVHLVVIIAIIGSIGWLVYTKACSLAGGVGQLGSSAQLQFNNELRDYLLVFSLVGVILGIVIHYYLLRQTLRPIHELIQSTKQLRQGAFPDPIRYRKTDEVGELITHYNALIEQLAKSERTREKTISDVSHEFRTPLTNLTGFLQALAHGDIEGNQQLYEALGEEANKLQHMVEQLEQLKEWDHVHRDTYVRKEVVNMKDLNEQCIAMYKNTLEKAQISLEIDIEEKHVFVHTTGIQQVIGNLLDNAIRYYEGTGPIKLRGFQDDDSYRFELSNPGRVIHKEEKAQIFKRFYQINRDGSPSTAGKGLGLAICKEIIHQHQGDIYTYHANMRNVFGFTIPDVLANEQNHLH